MVEYVTFLVVIGRLCYRFPLAVTGGKQIQFGESPRKSITAQQQIQRRISHCSKGDHHLCRFLWITALVAAHAGKSLMGRTDVSISPNLAFRQYQRIRVVEISSKCSGARTVTLIPKALTSSASASLRTRSIWNA